VVCQQHVDHAFSSRLLHWWDGRMGLVLPLVPQAVGTSVQLLLLRWPPFVVFECCSMCMSWGVGMWVRSFPLLVAVVTLGRLSCKSFSSLP
jgi:hypothetical protein